MSAGFAHIARITACLRLLSGNDPPFLATWPMDYLASVPPNRVRKMLNIKLVVIGNEAVGKSCFVLRATDRHFWQCEYIPTVFDKESVDLMLNGSPCSVSLWDTAGQEEYDHLRPLSYPKTNVFVVCFNVASRSSFENVTEKWVPELRYSVPEAPVLLLAMKTDLRGSR